MSEFVLKPKEVEVDEKAKAPDVQFEQLTDELKGAERAEGEDQVVQAVLEVKAGVAQPEALLEWMDDLREFERQEPDKDDNLERSFTVDFIPDTARDNSATESPPGDDYMFFSANRRTPAGDDDEGGGGGGGGGDGGGDGGDEGGEGDKPADDPSTKKPGNAAKPAPAKPAKPPPKSAPPPPGGGKKSDG